MEDYPYIPAVPRREAVLRRMGMKPAERSDMDREIDGFLRYAQAQFSVSGRAGVFRLEHTGAGRVRIAGEEIESAQLSRLLGTCAEAYIMCAAVPERETRLIGEALARGEGLKALALDAYASELADGALDYLMEKKNIMLKRTGRSLTAKRFSAGYGDLDIKYQKVLYELSGMSGLGVRINDKYLLTPEKSVIAIAGVR